MIGESSRQTSLSIDLGGEQVLLERIEAVEALSTPFLITLEIISELGEIDLLPHLGKPASVSISQDQELLRHFHGLATEAEFTTETSSGFHYRLVLRPWTYFLSHNRDFAIYQEQDVVEIIKHVLDEAGVSDVDYTWLQVKSRAKRTYCVQYDESDFAFISRLMEEEGIYYYFKHSGDRHVLVLCDSPSSHSEGHPATLIYNPHNTRVFNVDSVARTERSREYYIQSWVERVFTGGEAKVTVRDFDFEKPERPLEAVAEADQAHPRDAVEVYTYPFRYVQESEGKKLGTVLLDALRTERRVYRGKSQASGLSCGTKVTIGDHYNSRLDGEFLIQQTFHSVQAERYRTGETSDEEPYNVVFEAVPAGTHWHAPRTTPRPIVHGLETAVITGPEGEEIYTDEYGRVKVRFHWDRSGSAGEKSTCWMRVSQTGGLGNIILPRIGHEVLVDFLGGDPDRPLVVGRVFNRTHMPIYPLPDNKTIALWRTKTYGQSGNYSPGKDLDTGKPRANELRFEDKGGKEEVFLHAERDMKTRIRYKESHHVGCDQEIDIGHDRSEHVEQNEKVVIGKNRKVEIGNDDSLKVTNNIKVRSGNKIDIKAATKITLTVGASKITMDPSSIKIESPMITVQADATAKLTSPLTTVEGTGILTLTGGLVKIN
jgi:type VI secretion system secreted protein VgrG